MNIEAELSEIAQKYSTGVENVTGIKASNFYPIIHKACTDSALVVGLEAGLKIEELCEMLNASIGFLRKYQSRYHGAEHAQEFWKEVNEFLSHVALEAQSLGRQPSDTDETASDPPGQTGSSPPPEDPRRYPGS